MLEPEVDADGRRSPQLFTRVRFLLSTYCASKVFITECNAHLFLFFDKVSLKIARTLQMTTKQSLIHDAGNSRRQGAVSSPSQNGNGA